MKIATKVKLFKYKYHNKNLNSKRFLLELTAYRLVEINDTTKYNKLILEDCFDESSPSYKMRTNYSSYNDIFSLIFSFLSDDKVL